MIIDDLFKLHNAKSRGFEDYEKGEVTFVTNGFTNNGILGHVKPKKGDRVFHFSGLCLSAFCEATVQEPDFIPRGNGGSGLLVLEPKEEMSFDKMIQIASYINSVHRWRFSYGRMVNAERAQNLEIEIDDELEPKNNVKGLIRDKRTEIKRTGLSSKFKLFNITELFDLERGHFHALDRLVEGRHPTVSRVAYDNGIVGFFEKPKGAKLYPKGTITVATTTGDAFVQLDDFIATDNVVILIPKETMSLDFLFFVAAMINRERWRVSYGRQCYKTVFAKTNIFLPIDDSEELDKEYVDVIASNSYNLKNVESYINAGE